MTFLESLTVSLFGLTIVFAVLIALSFIVKIQSILSGALAMKMNRSKTGPDDAQDSGGSSPETYEGLSTEGSLQSTGQVALIGTDDMAAAIIMAVVSHESQTPLSELQFKCIKAVEQ